MGDAFVIQPQVQRMYEAQLLQKEGCLGTKRSCIRQDAFTTAILVQQAAETYILVMGGISVNHVSRGFGMLFVI